MIELQEKLRMAERELLHKALHDTLTGLPNRILFFDRLEQACAQHRRKHAPFAVLVIDCDGFKKFNEVLGHAGGDALLNQIGQRFTSCLRRVDTVARLGGDEFAVILTDVNSEPTAQLVAAKLAAMLNQPFLIDGRTIMVGASFGIALCPDHGSEALRLLSHADNAMHRAKAAAGRIAIYDPQLAEPRLQSAGELDLGDLEAALARNEMEWYFQPKIHLGTREVLGFEALARWTHPSLGRIEPDQFIPLIEHSYLLPDFTYKSLEFVLAQMSAWHRAGIKVSSAINISARMLEHYGFTAKLMDMIGKFGVDPACLSLELTETALIANPYLTRQIIDELAGHQIHLSIDDFGAGFTSFGYLRDFRVIEIKIDKSYSLETDADGFNATLVNCLAVFCRARGIKLVAEGIETTGRWSELLSLGCEVGQGFSIARPMPASEVPSWLQHWNAASVPQAGARLN